MDDRKSHAPAGIRTQERLSRSAVTVPTLTELERTLNERAVVRFESVKRLEGLRETTKKLSKDSLYSDQEKERATPEQKLLPEPLCTIML
jgi:hypothetical protein